MAKKKPRPTVSHLATPRFSRRGLRSYFEYRDLGVSRATGGPGARPCNPGATREGAARRLALPRLKVQFTYEGQKPIVMKAGSCFLQPPRIRHREISHSKDLEMIEVTAPQRFKTYDAKVR